VRRLNEASRSVGGRPAAPDQITPARYGETITRQLPNSTLVEVPGVGHSPLFAAGPCGIRAAAAFFDDPAAPPPVACLRRGGGR